jgi:Suppressor of fused protein (SUFU)
VRILLTPHEEIHRQPAPDDAARYSASDRDALERHYAQCFGDYFRVIHEKVSIFVHIDIYIYGASPERPYVTLATSGMGAADSLDEHNHPTELVTYLPADWDFSDSMSTALFSSILMAARYPHETKTIVSRHHTLCCYDGRTNLADAIFPGSALTHWYFRLMIHEPEGFEHLVLPSNRHVNLLWAYPITRDELYFLTHSEDHLELEYLLAEEADIALSVDRKCLIRPENRAERRARLKIQAQARRKTPRKPWMELPCEYPPHG